MNPSRLLAGIQLAAKLPMKYRRGQVNPIWYCTNRGYIVLPYTSIRYTNCLWWTL